MAEIKTDPITLQRIQLMHPAVRENCLQVYMEMCAALNGKAMPRFAYTLRTFSEQQALYDQGRKKLYDAKGNRLGKVTNAKAGQSYHNYGLAFDLVLLTDEGKKASWDTVKDFDGDGQSDWMECVAIAKKHGWSWGGDFKSFKDMPHFEMTLGYTIPELYRMHEQGKYNSQYLAIKV